MENLSGILDILIKLLAALVAGAVAAVMPKIRALMVSKFGQQQASNLESMVKTFVESAEQLLKEDDPEGSKRKQYVEKCLVEMEIEITAYVNALIEKEVFDLNRNNN